MNSNLEAGTIILAGATGDLGGRITENLIQRGAKVRALVRPGTSPEKINKLENIGVSVLEVDYTDPTELAKAFAGGSVVISALSGLREVMVDTQTLLLNAAIEAGVPRFIPSDFAVDFTPLPMGTNRNLDFRQEFRVILDQAPIRATSILNGMFTDLLTGQAPVIFYPMKRIIFWGDANQLLDFTTIANTAEYTASAALDPTTPRYLRIAGDVQNAHGLLKAAQIGTGDRYKLFRVGSLGVLDVMIKVTKAMMPTNDEVFPPWQGMQYLRSMFSGVVKLQPLDNDRYPGMRWTSVQEVVASRPVSEK